MAPNDCTKCHKSDRMLNGTSLLLQCIACTRFWHHSPFLITPWHSHSLLSSYIGCHRPPVPDRDLVNILSRFKRDRESGNQNPKFHWTCAACIAADDDIQIIEALPVKPATVIEIDDDEEDAKQPRPIATGSASASVKPSQIIATPAKATITASSVISLSDEDDSDDPTPKASSAQAGTQPKNSSTSSPTPSVIRSSSTYKDPTTTPSQRLDVHRIPQLKVVSHNPRTGISIVDDPLPFSHDPNPKPTPAPKQLPVLPAQAASTPTSSSRPVSAPTSTSTLAVQSPSALVVPTVSRSPTEVPSSDTAPTPIENASPITTTSHGPNSARQPSARPASAQSGHAIKQEQLEASLRREMDMDLDADVDMDAGSGEDSDRETVSRMGHLHIGPTAPPVQAAQRQPSVFDPNPEESDLLLQDWINGRHVHGEYGPDAWDKLAVLKKNGKRPGQRKKSKARSLAVMLGSAPSSTTKTMFEFSVSVWMQEKIESLKMY
ncbi:hypothetical protein D9613_000537 [Agrocybe pediades]|uniref:Uncharacterized protein n=1 Tax=Agrocybe pediades TaxID=84607 RepID=A0A8H4R0T9_9AGAR|nr:hypothetical protein D9613_000537 [Agrocybe pediades]